MKRLKVIKHAILVIAVILSNGFSKSIAQTSEVVIGTQTWMSENLNVEHYRNGAIIPQVQDKNEWSNLNTGAWCYYENDSIKGKTFGKIYNWYAVNDSRGLAPEGWHTASDTEWTKLISYLGDYLVAGGKLKDERFWETPNTGATNESGISVLPSGLRYDSGDFNFIGVFAYFWSCSESDNETSWVRLLSYKNTVVFRLNSYKRDGLSVRCIKDN